MGMQISNGLLTARINEKGAELTSLFHHAFRLEYMWDADPAYWAKTSPVLFPVVGALRNGSYEYRGKTFDLPRHGFARDHVFTLEKKEPSKVVFLLRETEETRKVFPFQFELRIIYHVEEFTLYVTYEVTNPSIEPMYFSIGAHPAFKLPLIEGTSYEDYFLQFESPEQADRWPISKEGLIESSPEPLLKNENVLPLRKDLFYGDALVFKNLKSSAISLRSRKHTHGVDFTFDGFPFFGIWAAKDADFICLEPWCGIADSVSHNQQLEKKEGIHILARHARWARTWSVKCY